MPFRHRLLSPLLAALLTAGCTPELAGLLLDGSTTTSVKGATPAPRASGGSTAGSAATVPVADPTGRSTADQPDDSPNAQIHVLYVLASDSPDENLDTNGTIARCVRNVTTWMDAQTGGSHLRFDTHQGALDVSFARLKETAAEIAYVAPSLDKPYGLDKMRIMLADRFSSPNKLYLIFYGGAVAAACGQGKGSYERPEAWCVLNLKGDTTSNSDRPYNCANDTFATDATTLTHSNWEQVLIHECIHALGMVNLGARNHYGANPHHVWDDPHDIMYDYPWTPMANPVVLDAGHDDYYKHGRPEIPDLARMTIMEPLPADAVPPPGWPGSPWTKDDASLRPADAPVARQPNGWDPNHPDADQGPDDEEWMDHLH
jgi:hypothetical protein